MDEYKIRLYQPEDRDDFLSLYATVMGETKREDWFDWKYAENPYIDHIPIFVARYQGRVIGSRPFFALPVVINGNDDVVLQPGDAMVHPDHRRQGLFSRLMEQAIEKYSDEYPFYFTFPNNVSGPAHLNHGAEVVTKRTCYYRIENPENLARSRTSQRAIRLLAKIISPVAKGYYGFQDYTTTEAAGVSIRAESEPPVEQLATLYRNSIPEQIHAHRDEQFYQWRFKNPDWEYTTFIAENESVPVAAIITGTAVKPELTTTKFTDIIPLGGQPNAALVSLLSHILEEHSETGEFIIPGQGFPESIIKSFGFHSDGTPPLSFLASKTEHVVRSLSNDWEQDGLDIREPESWLMTFVEDDTS